MIQEIYNKFKKELASILFYSQGPTGNHYILEAPQSVCDNLLCVFPIDSNEKKVIKVADNFIKLLSSNESTFSLYFDKDFYYNLGYNHGQTKML